MFRFTLLTSLLGTFLFADLPKDYESWTGCEKADYVWKNKIVPSEYRELPGLNFGGWPAFLNALKAPAVLATLNKTFDYVSDEIPPGRRKMIHPFGTVARVVWRAGGAATKYTGLYAEKEVCGFGRLSVAGPPLVGGFIPGMALKLFVDKKPSVNLMVMYSLQGQGDDENFFSHTFTNVLPPIEASIFDPFSLSLLAGEKIFATAKKNPRFLSAAEFSFVTAKGDKVEKPVFPWKLAFVPEKKAKSYFEAEKNEGVDFREVLGQVAKGTALYRVYAYEDKDAKPELIGSLETTGSFVASKYGDDTLFFRHYRD